VSWAGRKVLVTGAGGFIGSHLTERLLSEGASVNAFVHYNALGTTGWLRQLAHNDDLSIIAGDVQDRDSVILAMEDVEVVFHLAALIAIPYSYRAPLSYLRVNAEGTLNVMHCAREAHVRRVVHTSTSEVYGTAQYVPIDERHPLVGQSPYSASKIAADKMAEAAHLAFGVPVVTVRPFNTFGPRQSARAVVPTIISQCLTGDVVRLGSVHPVRDLNYVLNTVDGFLRAGTVPNIEGKTINLGTGREISIGDLAQTIIGMIGREVRLLYDAARKRPDASEVDRLRADATLARSVLGWEPKVSLEDGLAKTIEWITENLNAFRPGAYVV
jgi:dTDP-glucose 4,6-dehydratase